MAETPVHLPWLDAFAYAVWASKSLPTLVQWQRAAGGNEGMVPGHLAEWHVRTDGPRLHQPIAVADKRTGFRCVLTAAEMLELLAI